MLARPHVVALGLLLVSGLLFSSPAAAQTLPFAEPHVRTPAGRVPAATLPVSRRVLLVVNTASYCGYTPQYEGLEKLHAQYAARGLTVLGFPSGDFGNQEKANNKEIADFCFTYGVKFPMFAKSSVAGPSANLFYGAFEVDRPAAEVELSTNI